MNSNQQGTNTVPQKRRTPLLVYVLAVIFVVFCGILIFVWVATKRAHPVMLDQQGKPLEQQSQPAGGAR